LILKKLISLPILLFALFLCGGMAAPANTPADYSATIVISGEHRYKALRLSPPIYNAANSNLSDLRIVDSRGEYTPYFIHNNVKETSAESETYELMLINSYVKDENFYFDYKLARESESDTIATSIKFTTYSSNFAKTVDVYGSYDNRNWQFIQSDKLYAIDDAVKLSIDFEQAQKYTHYRLRLANNLEQITFISASLDYSVQTAAQYYFIESLSPSFSVEEEDKTTRITIYGLQNLHLYDIAIHTDSMFKRIVSTSGGVSKELYNLTLNDMTLASLNLPLAGRQTLGDSYTLTIANGDDKPINISGITARYYADELVFEALAGETYRLEFGASAEKTTPEYDISRYMNEILKGDLDQVGIGEIVYTVKAEPLPQRDYKPIFNIVVIVIALILGTVILLKLKHFY